EVTLDLHKDDTVVLRGIEPVVSTINLDGGVSTTGNETTTSTARSSSSMIRRNSSSMLRRLSHEVNAKAKQFSQELKRFSLSHAVSDSVLAARDLRKQRAQHDRNRS
ncbi:respiratory burst oxidase protein A-like, partial [Trifolium medium]|nr:respiratory burst oxidase protein A-like [Trifolium medium]